jgi:hypothetical protein
MSEMPPPSPYEPGPPAPPEQAPGNTLSIIGIICGCIAVGFCPPGFGIAGIVLGIIGRTKRERLSTAAIIVAALGMVVGIGLGVMRYKSLQG